MTGVGKAVGFRPGELVRVEIPRVQVVTAGTSEAGPWVMVMTDGGGYEILLNAADVVVTRLAPAEWPPRPGDLWRSADGELWFAYRYGTGDGERSELRLMSPQAGPYVGSYTYPDRLLAERGPLDLVHRDLPAEPDGESS